MKIRRVLALTAALVLCVTLCACQAQKKQELTQAEIEEVAADYGNAIVLANEALEETFANVEGFKVDQCYTAVLTDKDFHIAISFTFTYDGGEGEYGFECEKADGEWKIVRQGRDISVQSLLGAQ
ncbi:MAG: hypothetical protein ACI4XW_08625 [Candidatus Spyradocola sp.]